MKKYHETPIFARKFTFYNSSFDTIFMNYDLKTILQRGVHYSFAFFCVWCSEKFSKKDTLNYAF